MLTGLRAATLDGVALSPLALAARSYWRCSRDARIALPLGMEAQAVEVIEHLRDLAETGPAAIRARAAASLPPFLSQLTALAESRP